MADRIDRAGLKVDARLAQFIEGEVLAPLGKDADGVLGIIDWDPSFPYKDDIFGTAQEFADNYKAKYKVDADYTGAGCAVSGMVLQLALKQLGKGPGLSEDDRAQLAKIIGATDIHTFYGPIKFDQSGPHFHDNTLPPPMLAQIQGGKFDHTISVTRRITPSPAPARKRAQQDAQETQQLAPPPPPTNSEGSNG